MIKPTMSLILPSRGRPLLLKQLFNNIYEKTLYKDGVEIIVLLDDDDVESHDVSFEGLNIKKVILSRSNMGFYNTRGLEESSGDIIILMNDDMLIQTSAWDERIREFDAQFTDKIYLAYPNDLFKKKCTFPILSRTTCFFLGKPFPVEYKGSFIDTHLYDVFERLQQAGIKRTFFLEDIEFEHRHYRSGKAAFDDTYKNRNRFGDDQVFVDLIPLRQKNARDLIDIISGQSKALETHIVQPVNLHQGDVLTLIKNVFRLFFKDKQLPFKWRNYLTAYFFARTVYYRFITTKNNNSFGVKH